MRSLFLPNADLRPIEFERCESRNHVLIQRQKARSGEFGWSFQFGCTYCQKSLMRYLKLWRDCVRKEFPDFEYQLTKEPQKSGSIHVHLLISNGSQGFGRCQKFSRYGAAYMFDPYEYLKRTWCRITGAGVRAQNIKESPSFKALMQQTRKNSPEVRVAIIESFRDSSEYLDTVKRTVRYVNKYLMKSVKTDIPKFAHRSTRSHGWGMGISYASVKRDKKEAWLLTKFAGEPDFQPLSRDNGWFLMDRCYLNTIVKPFVYSDWQRPPDIEPPSWSQHSLIKN